LQVRVRGRVAAQDQVRGVRHAAGVDGLPRRERDLGEGVVLQVLPDAGQVVYTVAERARVRMDAAVAATRSREAVDRLVSVSGASAFALTNPLQRIWRDLGTASRHGVVNPDLGREIYGRSLLSIAEQPTFII
jgi:alkylation response protein AidB-like acyl-CoA dehydrogenase